VLEAIDDHYLLQPLFASRGSAEGSQLPLA
jgi:hypothetical protein